LKAAQFLKSVQILHSVWQVTQSFSRKITHRNGYRHFVVSFGTAQPAIHRYISEDLNSIK